jgi:uncharacterized protein (TIGR02001 family)
LAIPLHASAQISSTLTLANNYLWRGQTFSSNKPTVQASIDYVHPLGLSLGVFVSNAETTAGTGTVINDTETDYYISYSYSVFEKLSVSASAYWYTYVLESRCNAGEYFVAMTYDPIKFEFSVLPKYFAYESLSTYVRLSAKQPLAAPISVVGHIGRASFSDEKKVGYKGYTDYSAGFSYSKDGYTTEITYNNTDREDLNSVALKDRAILATISKTF